MKQRLLLNDVPAGPGFIEDWAGRNGCLPVAGVDEAGRGCWAGPVVTAAVILPETFDLPGLDDSKTISHSDREALFEPIRKQALSFAVTMASNQEIDRTNILAATLRSMRDSVTAACRELSPGIVIVDGNQPIPGLGFNQRPWTKADHLSWAVAAASILAKVTRDRLMVELDGQYPGYGFAAHKGYGTRVHQQALERLGPCPIHRMSFRPLSNLAGAGDTIG